MKKENEDMDESYEPSEEELKEIEDLINKDAEEEAKEGCGDCGTCKPKNRIKYLFNSESHWIGWLKIHGIKWEK